MPNENPYTSAVAAYGNTAASVDPRALEGTILLKSAMKLEDLAKRLKAGEKVTIVEKGDVLEYNQKLWQLFVSETINPDHPLPQELKNNIATLGMFVFKRTLELLADPNPDKIQALVEINRNIAAGLLKKPAAPPPVPGTLGKKKTDMPAASPADNKPTDSLA